MNKTRGTNTQTKDKRRQRLYVHRSAIGEVETAGESEKAEVNHREEDEESKAKSKVERTTNSKIAKTYGYAT